MTDRPARSPLHDLAQRHRDARAGEAYHRDNRRKIEAEIIAITGLKEHGQKTIKEGTDKFTVTPNWSYKIDWDLWDAIAPHIPNALHPIKQSKREADPAKIRALKRNPPLYALLAGALTVTPLSPTVEISAIEASA